MACQVATGTWDTARGHRGSKSGIRQVTRPQNYAASRDEPSQQGFEPTSFVSDSKPVPSVEPGASGPKIRSESRSCAVNLAISGPFQQLEEACGHVAPPFLQSHQLTVVFSCRSHSKSPFASPLATMSWAKRLETRTKQLLRAQSSPVTSASSCVSRLRPTSGHVAMLRTRSRSGRT